MSEILVDDRSSQINYSKPASGHHWSTNGSSGSHDGTLTFTRHGGSTASITFEGNRIVVYGTLSPRGTGPRPTSTYSIDGGTPRTFNPTETSSTQNRVVFFDSGTLSGGPSHTLLVTSLVEDSYFWLDYFAITPNPPSSGGGGSSGGGSSGGSDGGGGGSSGGNNGGDSGGSGGGNAITQTQTSTRVITTQVVIGSSTLTTVSTETNTATITSTSSTSTSSDTALATPGTSGAADSNSVQRDPPIGAIVGGVLGGLALLLLFAFLFWRQNQKYKHRKLDKERDQLNASTTPYVVPPTNYPGAPSTSSHHHNESVTSASTQWHQGGYSQRYLHEGNVGPEMTAVTPTTMSSLGPQRHPDSSMPLGPSGKRQMMGSPSIHSENSNTALLEAQRREQDRMRACATSPTTSNHTEYTNTPSDLQGSLYTDISVANHMSVPEEEPPAYFKDPTPGQEQRLDAGPSTSGAGGKQ